VTEHVHGHVRWLHDPREEDLYDLCSLVCVALTIVQLVRLAS
jgi:hypothetical protein